MAALGRARLHRQLRWGSVVTGLLLLGVAASVLPLEHVVVSMRSEIRSFGAAAPLVYGGLHVLGAVLLMPVMLLTVGAGYVLGPVWGIVVASLASTTAAAASFAIGRAALRSGLARRIERSPKLAAIHAAIGREGWRLIALLRLSPLIPFGLGNYFYGVTPVRFRDYVLATWAAMFPGTCLHVLLGAAGRSAFDGHRSPLELAYMAVGLVATLVAILWTTRAARRELRRRVGTRSPHVTQRDPGAIRATRTN
jgi:uncharacterized membrane protein YdjX (TVP38/TMEM64 family)